MLSKLFSLFQARSVKAYWWCSVPNFGDAITPLLLNHFSEIKTEWSPICSAQVISTGSILEHVPPHWGGYIVGCGKLIEDSRLHLYTNTAKILLLRGPLSAKGVSGNFTFGDPGLLANELVGSQEKFWDLGIVPHWRDKELADKFLKMIKPPSTCKVIDPSDDPLTVIRQIGACKRIVTSSLHGMIVADSFNIPRRVEICPALAKEGGDFKFRDYSASIGMPFKTGKMEQPNPLKVNDVKFEIYAAFKELETLLRKK